MALRFMDSFDHYTGDQFLRKWLSSRGGNAGFVTGRFGSAWDGLGRWARKQLSDAPSTWIIGVAAQLSAMTVTDNLFALIDTTSNWQCSLAFNRTTNQFQFYRGIWNSGTAIGPAYTLIPALNQWYYLEMKFVIHNSTGSVELRVDGPAVISATNQDTQNTSNAFADTLHMGSTNDAFWVPNFDDLYVCDGTGSAPTNDFLGDCRVESRMPNGNGNSSQFVGSDSNSTDNYLLVDETPGSNDDTDYVESATIGNKDTYTYQDLTSTAGTVYGIQILPTARKTDAGFRSMKTVARLSATETDGPEQRIGNSYAIYSDIRETKPGGGVWTISDVNSAEFGVKVFA